MGDIFREWSSAENTNKVSGRCIVVCETGEEVDFDAAFFVYTFERCCLGPPDLRDDLEGGSTGFPR